uniref:Uncharacterized protein n=1 Tax=Romanomermis culicivorax TaxID=13658 RepID=A0A915KX65_ROMCU
MLRVAKAATSITNCCKKRAPFSLLGWLSWLERVDDDRHQQHTTDPIFAHSIIEHEDQICISVSKLPRCKGRSYPGDELEKRQAFHCLNKREQKAQEWKRMLDEERQDRDESHNLRANQYFTQRLAIQHQQKKTNLLGWLMDQLVIAVTLEMLLKLETLWLLKH